jgi:hypothetical protein
MLVSALYIGGLPYFHRRLPSLRHRLVRIVMLIGYVLAMLLPPVATFFGVGVDPLKVGIAVEMIIWSLGAAWFATWLAYGVSGEAKWAEAATLPKACR